MQGKVVEYLFKYYTYKQDLGQKCSAWDDFDLNKSLAKSLIPLFPSIPYFPFVYTLSFNL